MAFFIPDDYFRQVIQEYRAQLPLRAMTEYPKEMVLPLHTQTLLKSFFDSMMPYFLQTPRPSESLIELKCRELLFSLLSDHGNAGLLSYIKHICDSRRPSLEEVMESNYMYNLSLAEFARIAQRSLATFNREFAGQFGTTPGKWLTQKRLAYAQLLLDTTKKNISEVADDCGFENSTHFSRVFKERFGSPPRQYREQAEK
jgi:AraC-like DNA-binding protein